ncbi:hypothetical protein YPPY66_1635, partial [Yersinia pestis PY-66]
MTTFHSARVSYLGTRI